MKGIVRVLKFFAVGLRLSSSLRVTSIAVESFALRKSLPTFAKKFLMHAHNPLHENKIGHVLCRTEILARFTRKDKFAHLQ
jgi:hypothetical protein